MNLTLISNTIQNQDCRNVKFQECITVPTRSTNQQSRQEIRILELQNAYLVIQTKLNLVLTSDTISLSLEQRHEIRSWTTRTLKNITPEQGMSTWSPLTGNHKKRSCTDKPPIVPRNIGFVICKLPKTLQSLQYINFWKDTTLEWR